MGTKLGNPIETAKQFITKLLSVHLKAGKHEVKTWSD